MGLMLALPAQAQTIIYQTDFSGNAGTLPDDWTARIVGASSTFALDGSGHMVYSFTEGNRGNSAVYWTGDAGSITDGFMTDAKITSLLTWPSQNNLQSMGILGRVQDITLANPQGYFVGIYRTGSTNYLIIATNPGGNAFGSILGQTPLVDNTGNVSYLLEANFSGNTLTASLYDASGQEVKASLSLTNTTYESGVFGLRVNSETPSRQFAFDNYTIAVPEPSPVAMLVVAGAVFAFIVTRKRKVGQR